MGLPTIPSILVQDEDVSVTPESEYADAFQPDFDCSWAGKHEGPKSLRMALEYIGGTDDERADIRLRNALTVIRYAYDTYNRQYKAFPADGDCLTLAVRLMIPVADFIPFLHRTSNECTYQKFECLIAHTQQTLAAHSAIVTPEKHFLLTWANEECTVAVTCIIPGCQELVDDVFSTTDASFDNGFTVSDVESKMAHMEGLCQHHREDDYTNESLNWIAEWNSIDVEYIQQSTIDLNWVKPPTKTPKSEVARIQADVKSGARKEMRRHIKHHLRQLSNTPHFDEENLELVPLGRSRRQNSSHTGDVFNPVIGDHRPENPQTFLLMV